MIRYNNSSTALGMMPPQKLSESDKDEDWMMDCVDSICARGYFRYRDNRSVRDNKISNYNLLKGIISDEEYSYILDPYQIPERDRVAIAPAAMRNYNIIFNKFNYLVGKELERPFNFSAMAVNGEAVSELDAKLKEELLAGLDNAVANAVKSMPRPEIDPIALPEGMMPEEDPTMGKQVMMPQQQPMVPDTGSQMGGFSPQPAPSPEQEQPEGPEEIQDRVLSTYKSIAETASNDLLEFLHKELDLRGEFNEGWKHSLITGEEVYYIGERNGKPYIRSVNPIYFEFDRGPDTKTIEECHWAREDRFMTPSQILDEYGEYLTEEEVEAIDKFRVGNNVTMVQMPGFVFRNDSLGFEDNSQFSSYDNTNFLIVSLCTWKSMRKVKFMSYVDEFGDEQEEMVEANYKPTKEEVAMGAKFETRWVTEVWEGTKIGSNIFVNIRPLPQQVHNFDYSKSKLPYVGTLYNSINTKSVSWVDMVKPHQILYNIIMFRLELEIAKAKGKKFIMDLAQIPKSEGIDMEKWIQYFDNAGLAFVNSAEEGNEDSFHRGDGVRSFNQFQAVDMTLSQSVGQYISILTKIEAMVDSLSGVSQQAQGQTFASETATGVNTAVTQSMYVVEPYYYMHDDTKRRALQQLLELAMVLYADGKKIKHITDDLGVKFINFVGSKVSLSEICIFVNNSAEDLRVIESMKQAAMAALQAGNAKVSDIMDVFMTKSIAKLKELVKTNEMRQEQMSQQQQQQQMALEQEKVAVEREKMAMEDRNKQLDREKDIQVATIKALGFSENPDVNQNMESDIMEQSGVATERLGKLYDIALKNKEINNKDKQHREKLDIEKYKADVSLQIARENENRYDQNDG